MDAIDSNVQILWRMMNAFELKEGSGTPAESISGERQLHIRKKYHLGRASVEGTHWGDVVFALPDGKLLLEVREGIETFAILLSMWY